jgi:hypothetical protein
MPFLYNQTPRWLDYSGLPQKLSENISKQAWPLLKRLMELDSIANQEPDVFQEPLEKIIISTGLSLEEIRDTLLALKEQGYIECYLPDTEQELAFFKVVTPMQTPISPLEIPMEEGGFQGSIEPLRLRYYSPPQLDESISKSKQILHLYFDLCGMKLNSLVFDDLKEMETQFPMEKIRDAFEKAKKYHARSLRPVFGILYGKEIKGAKLKKSGEISPQEEQ